MGLAVPMSRPRYTAIESALIISPLTYCAKEIATTVFPEAVGPTIVIIGLFCKNSLIMHTATIDFPLDLFDNVET